MTQLIPLPTQKVPQPWKDCLQAIADSQPPLAELSFKLKTANNSPLKRQPSQTTSPQKGYLLSALTDTTHPELLELIHYTDPEYLHSLMKHLKQVECDWWQWLWWVIKKAWHPT